MLRPAEADIGALIEALSDAGVAFIVVGGAAALLHGAPIATRDLDIVPEQTADNLDKLATALESLDAIVREPGGRELRPSRTHLDGNGQILLRTNLGPLDVLLRLHAGEDYAALVPDSVEREGDGLTIRMLSLPKLIAIKAATGRARDRITVPLLLELLRREEAEATDEAER